MPIDLDHSGLYKVTRSQGTRDLLRGQQSNLTINFGRVGVAAAHGALAAKPWRRVDQHLHLSPHTARQLGH